MDLTADFSKFQQDVSKALVGTIRTTNQIADDDLSFHRSSSTKASGALDGLSSNLLQLTNKLLKAATQDTNIKIPRVKSLEGLDDNWRGVVDVVDNLLEKADIARDEYSGVIRKQTPDQDGTATPPLPRDRSRRAPGVFDDPSMRKPQLDFLRPVDNFTIAPFKPVLQRKPHAKVSLDQSIGDGQSGKYVSQPIFAPHSARLANLIDMTIHMPTRSNTQIIHLPHMSKPIPAPTLLLMIHKPLSSRPVKPFMRCWPSSKKQRK